MTVTNQNLEIYRGDSAVVFVGLTDEAGEPFDANTATAIHYRVSKTTHALNNEAVIFKEMNAGIAAAEGGINISFNSNDTDLLPALYYHELKILGSVLGEVSTAFVGNVTIRRALKMGESQQAQLHVVGTGVLSGTMTP